MTITFILTVALISGFITTHLEPYTKMRLHRIDGRNRHMISAAFGALNLFLAVVFLWGLSAVEDKQPAFLVQFLDEQIYDQGALPKKQDMADKGSRGNSDAKADDKAGAPHKDYSAGWALSVSLLSIAMGAVAVPIASALWFRIRFNDWRIREFMIKQLLKDSRLQLFLNSLLFDKERFAMLTMADRKVYAGEIIGFAEPSSTKSGHEEFVIAPLVSGYRDEQTLEVKFTTHYNVEINGQSVPQRSLIYLRFDQVLSAMEFDPAVFEAFQEQEPPDEKGVKKEGSLTSKTGSTERP